MITTKEILVIAHGLRFRPPNLQTFRESPKNVPNVTYNSVDAKGIPTHCLDPRPNATML